MARALSDALPQFLAQLAASISNDLRGTIQTEFTHLKNRLSVQHKEILQRFDGLERRMDGLECRMDGLEGRMDGLEHRMDGLERRMDGLENGQNALSVAVGEVFELGIRNEMRHLHGHKFCEPFCDRRCDGLRLALPKRQARVLPGERLKYNELAVRRPESFRGR